MTEWKRKGSGESDEWYTPKFIFDALGVEFDMDVASPKEGPRYTPCKSFLWERGLETEWSGFVWMNPPYGHQSTKIKWLDKFFAHGNGIALMPDRTSAPWWQKFAPMADCVLFVNGKIKFERPDFSVGKQPGNGTCLFGAGARSIDILKRSGLGVIL